MEPLTAQLTDEQIRRKQVQQRARAPPPGQSRILSRATREQKKQGKQVVQIINNNIPTINPSTPNPPPPQPLTQAMPQPIFKQTPPPQPQPQTPSTATTTTTQKESPTNKSIQPNNNINNNNNNNNETTIKASKIVENADADDWQTLIEELNPGLLLLCKKLCEKSIKKENAKKNIIF
jgi:hypothetical protein